MLPRLVRPIQPRTRKPSKKAASEQSAAQSRKLQSQRNHQIRARLEKSLAVLSKLKGLEFHSRANIEKLAELSLTIEEELKQKTFAEGSEPFTARRMHFNPRSWN